MAWSRAVRRAAVVLAAIALLRVALFVAHEPMLGYGNNYDQVRYTACVNVFPHGPDVPAGTASAGRPPVVAAWLADFRGAPCIWTSDLPFAVAARLQASYRAAANPAVPPVASVAHIGWLRFALLAITLAYCMWLLRERPSLMLGFAAAAAVVLPDPAVALWINTLYPEFTAVTALLLSVAWLLATDRKLQDPAGMSREAAAAPAPWRSPAGGWRHVAVGVVAAFALAMAKVQFAALPLALWMGFVAAQVLARRRPALSALPFLAGAVLGLAVQVVQLGRPDAFVHAWQRVALANVVFDGVLGSSADPAATTARLGLPTRCAALAGYNWFNAPTPLDAACPEALGLRRLRVIGTVLVEEPQTLLRLGVRAVAALDPWVQRYLGHVAGVHYGDVTRTRVGWTFSVPLERVRPWNLLLVLAPGAFLVAGLFVPACRAGRSRSIWVGAWLACAVIASMLVVTPLGDGVHNLARQAFLVYAAALFWGAGSLVCGLIAFARARCVRDQVPTSDAPVGGD